MSAIEVSDHGTRTAPIPWTATVVLFAAAGLFLGSAVLQVVASLQRWVGFRSSLSEPLSAEDHLYDYYWPYAPWEPIGTAAEFFGLGTLVLAVGILVMTIGVVAIPRTAGSRGVIVALLAIVEIVLASLVAGSFALHGAHALISGMTGVPSALRDSGALGWIGVLGLIILAPIWLRRSWAAAAACMFLIGSTGLGYFVAAFGIAPKFAGGTSHDTTPWTETVVAASAAATGAALLIAVWAIARSSRRRDSEASNRTAVEAARDWFDR
jgi:hypothetical protein